MQIRHGEELQNVPMRSVTHGPGHFFFGYYDKQQWDPTGRFLLGMRAAFSDRPAQRDDLLEIGMVDLQDGDRWIPLAETRAWCWQQGCMLQWVPGSRAQIIFNDRIGDRFVAVIMDVHSRERHQLPRPIYTLSNDGRQALSLNFSRLAVTRPGYGYAGLHEASGLQPDARDDGIWIMDLAGGEHALIISLAALVRNDPDPSMADQPHWVNHLLFAPSDERFIFLHRWDSSRGFFTRMFTAAADGTELHRCPVEDASHFIWKNTQTVLAWDSRPNGKPGFYAFTDRQDHAQLIADGVFTGDGHITVSPDECWLMTDTYPDDRGFKPVILYRVSDGRTCQICRLYGPMPSQVELRCDLHPRWSRDGRQICFDSVHEGSRQMYVADVSRNIDQDA